MSYSIDVNLLVYASDASSPFHDKARSFLESCLERSEAIGLAWTTLLGYLRIATHPRIFAFPLSHRQAAANVEEILSCRQVRLLSEEEGFWATYRDVTSAVPVCGRQVPDAHLAALLRHHGISILYTHDVDFRRFKFLEVRDPLA